MQAAPAEDAGAPVGQVGREDVGVRAAQGLLQEPAEREPLAELRAAQARAQDAAPVVREEDPHPE